ncbi:MAG: hypothetical protein CSA24_02030 [Deltaproteobacteria bacterium]|nr:MAG: hypothetical protein CSB49_08365 [Pseudomonadota bacterium]PIE65778.1 MAG: hypothetical protein CSA24_02030 [Deltaproteobacteria bacterium]
MRYWRVPSPITSLVLFAIAQLWGACGTTKAQAPTLRPASTSRLELTVSRLGGGTLALGALRKQVVVLTLFTTWSLRAQAETSRFNQIAARYAGKGVVVVGVALQRRGRALVKTYVDFVGLRFPVGIADPEDLRLVGALGLTKRVPRTLLYDQRGHLRQDHSAGQTDFPRLIEGIGKLLRSGAPPLVQRRSP